MRITDLELRKNANPSIAKAWGKVIFEDLLTINITVMDKGEGPWVTFPGRKAKDGKWVNEVYMNTREGIGKEISDQIIYKYNNLDSPQIQQNNMDQTPVQSHQTPMSDSEGSSDLPF